MIAAQYRQEWGLGQRRGERVRTILDFLLPPQCRLCEVRTDGEPIPWVCQQCWLAIEYVRLPTCYQCGEPFDAPPEGIVSPMHRCGACLLHPPPYERSRAVGMYRGVLREVIHAMKYQGA